MADEVVEELSVRKLWSQAGAARHTTAKKSRWMSSRFLKLQGTWAGSRFHNGATTWAPRAFARQAFIMPLIGLALPNISDHATLSVPVGSKTSSSATSLQPDHVHHRAFEIFSS
jgi:hypothetical protein